MTDIVIQNPVKSITDIPRAEIEAYMKKYNTNPLEAFADLLSDRLFRRIQEGQYQVVLRVLVESVVGKGLKDAGNDRN